MKRSCYNYLLIYTLSVLFALTISPSSAKVTNHNVFSKTFQNNADITIKEISLYRSIAVAIAESHVSPVNISTNQTTCYISPGTFSLKVATNTLSADKVLLRSPIYDGKLLTVATEDKIATYTANSSSIEKHSVVNLPSGSKNVHYDVFEENLLAIFNNNKLLFVDISKKSDSLSPRIVDLPDEHKLLQDICFANNFLFLAEGEDGVKIYDVINQTPKSVFNLTNIDLNSLSTLNITNVWTRKGILFVYDANKKRTVLLDIRSLRDRSEIKRIRGGTKIQAGKVIPTSSSHLHIVTGKTIYSYIDNTDYNTNNSRLNFEILQKTEYDSNVVSAYASSEHMFVSTESKAEFITQINCVPTKYDVNYNLASKKNSDTSNPLAFGVVIEAKEDRLLTISGETISVDEISYNAPEVHCKKPDFSHEDVRGFIVESISFQCPSRSPPPEIEVDRFNFVLTKEESTKTDNITFPETEIISLGTTFDLDQVTESHTGGDEPTKNDTQNSTHSEEPNNTNTNSSQNTTTTPNATTPNITTPNTSTTTTPNTTTPNQTTPNTSTTTTPNTTTPNQTTPNTSTTTTPNTTTEPNANTSTKSNNTSSSNTETNKTENNTSNTTDSHNTNNTGINEVGNNKTPLKEFPNMLLPGVLAVVFFVLAACCYGIYRCCKKTGYAEQVEELEAIPGQSFPSLHENSKRSDQSPPHQDARTKDRNPAPKYQKDYDSPEGSGDEGYDEPAYKPGDSLFEEDA